MYIVATAWPWEGRGFKYHPVGFFSHNRLPPKAQGVPTVGQANGKAPCDHTALRLSLNRCVTESVALEKRRHFVVEFAGKRFSGGHINQQIMLA